MPTNFLNADANFPRMTKDVPLEVRMERVTSYLYMLLEQLRYTLANLGEENFNDESLKEIGEAIQGPVLSIVTDLEGNVSTLEQTATSITSRLNNFNGSSSTIEQTATSLTTRLDDFNGSSSTIEQTATAITTRLNDFNGSGSTIEQTVSSIDTAVFDPSGELSLVSQKADRIDWIVASGTSAATMTLTSDMLALIADEINVQGVVTFTSLDTYLGTAGSTQVNGNNVLLQGVAGGQNPSYLVFTNENDNAFGYTWARDTSGDSVPFHDDYALTIEANSTIDQGTYSCGLLLEGGSTLRAEAAYVILGGRSWTAIRAGAPNASLTETGYYSFCTDGIYYGSTKILST